MSTRVQDLANRRESLRLRAAAQRAELAYSVGAIEHRLRRVDRTVNAVRRIGRKPLVLGAGAAILMMLGPKRLFRWGTRGLMAATSLRGVLKALH